MKGIPTNWLNMNIKLLSLAALAATFPAISARALVDSNATQETQDLYTRLQTLCSADGVAFGGQYALFQGLFADKTQWYNIDNTDVNSDIRNICGINPSVSGWDINEDAFYGDTWANQNIEAIKRAYEMGAIITISFHEDNPITGGAYGDTSDTDLSKVLSGGSAYDDFLEQWETAADFISKLETDDGTMIPVILRPFHELNGSWFWWGTMSDEDDTSKANFISMWQWLVGYLRDTKGLHNILYNYNTDKITSESEYLARWPGDDYVDIVTCDAYLADTASTDALTESLDVVSAVATAKSKPAALADTGPSVGEFYTTISDWWTTKLLTPLADGGYFTKIAYVAGWANWSGTAFMPYPGSTSSADFAGFLRDDHIFLIDYFDADAVWSYLYELGESYTYYYPWVYSDEQGWEYMTEVFNVDDGANWYYDTDLGWLWTQTSFYPYFWSSAEDNWVYYWYTSEGTRWFYSYANSEVESFSRSGY